MRKLKLGISSCPNDTFMFAHFIKEVENELHIEDIETLNKMAMEELSDVTKLSYHTWLKLSDKYNLLRNGGALGENCGPLIISKHKAYPDEIRDMNIAIPGELTTANLLLDIFYPDVKSKSVLVFSDIEEAVLSDEFDAGLIIHESRFTYQKKGLKKVADLGEIWEKEYNLPTPLGGIAIHKSIPQDIAKKIDRKLHDSIKNAFAEPSSVMPFVNEHAQEMDEEVMKKHISLYVNKYSYLETDMAVRSVFKLANAAYDKNIIKTIPEKIFP